MADKRLSQLADAGTLLATDSMLVVRGSTNYKAAVGNISQITTDLTISPGTTTSDTSALTINQTWDNASVGFTALSVGVTDSNSATLSNIAVVSVDGTPLLSMNKAGGVWLHAESATGNVRAGEPGLMLSADGISGWTVSGGYLIAKSSGQSVASFKSLTTTGTTLHNNYPLGFSSGVGVGTVFLRREDANTIAVTNSADTGYLDFIAGNLTVTGTMTTGAATIPATLTIWMPAPAMTARTSNGATAGSTETSTNKVMVETYDFGNTSAEYVQFSVAMPKGWDLGPVTAEFYWTAASSSGNVTWGLQAVAVSNDDVLDAAFGTAQEVNHTLTATDDLQHTAATANITVAGSPAAGDLTYFQLYRDPGTDTLAANASLVGVKLLYTVTTMDDV